MENIVHDNLIGMGNAKLSVSGKTNFVTGTKNHSKYILHTKRTQNFMFQLNCDGSAI